MLIRLKPDKKLSNFNTNIPFFQLRYLTAKVIRKIITSYTGTSTQELSPQEPCSPGVNHICIRGSFIEFIHFPLFHFTIRWRPWLKLVQPQIQYVLRSPYSERLHEFHDLGPNSQVSSRPSNGRVERNGKLVFSSSFDMAFERHLVYDLHAILPSRSFHLQAN